MVMSGKEAQLRLQKQYKRQNEFMKENYKRISVVIKKELYQNLIEKYGDVSMNGYITELIKKDLGLDK